MSNPEFSADFNVFVQDYRISNPGTRFIYGLVGPQVHFLILDAAPEQLNLNNAYPTTFTVHADFYHWLLQYASKRCAGELGTLACVEYLQYAITNDSLLQCINTEITIHRVGKATMY